MNLAYSNKSLLENYKWEDSMCTNILCFNSVSNSLCSSGQRSISCWFGCGLSLCLCSDVLVHKSIVGCRRACWLCRYITQNLATADNACLTTGCRSINKFYAILQLFASKSVYKYQVFKFRQ